MPAIIRIRNHVGLIAWPGLGDVIEAKAASWKECRVCQTGRHDGRDAIWVSGETAPLFPADYKKTWRWPSDRPMGEAAQP